MERKSQHISEASESRPDRFVAAPLPSVPEPDSTNEEAISTVYSRYRTDLSHHRTGLSEHRTDLSEYRTDLSTHRTEMAMRRSGMSIHRTRMSADRTLMSEIRTSLALIGFGFTIYQTFDKLREAGVIESAGAPRNFGLALLILGILLLVGGIARQVQFALELRHTRKSMTEAGLIHGESRYPVSITLIVAVLLLLLGVAAVAGIAFNIGGFG